MELNIVAIKDTKASLYQHIHTIRTNQEALRELQIAVNDDKTMISRYPTDYALYQIGTVDDVSGAIISMQPLFIVDAITLKQRKEVANESISASNS